MNCCEHIFTQAVKNGGDDTYVDEHITCVKI